MITFTSVSKHFGTGVSALDNISFVVNPGEMVLITGPSGSGKTTLMKLLTKEYLPTTGEIIFGETPLSAIKPGKVHEHRRRLGIIFQDYKLLPEYNVWENIALPLYIVGKSETEIEARVTDLLKLVNLVERAFHFPSQLSGGEAQRVSIARALATGPEVIFADEPTGNLDPDTSVAIAQLFAKINELGTTVMLATHDLGVVENLKSARRLHLEKGVLTKDSGAKKTGSNPKNTPPSTQSASPQPDKDNQKDHDQDPPPTQSKTRIPFSLPKVGWPLKKKTAENKDTTVEVTIETL